MCFTLTFYAGISFCYLERQRKENGLPAVTGKQASFLMAMQRIHPLGAALQTGTLQSPGHTLQSPFAQQSWKVNALLTVALLARVYQPHRHSCS